MPKKPSKILGYGLIRRSTRVAIKRNLIKVPPSPLDVTPCKEVRPPVELISIFQAKNLHVPKSMFMTVFGMKPKGGKIEDYLKEVESYLPANVVHDSEESIYRELKEGCVQTPFDNSREQSPFVEQTRAPSPFTRRDERNSYAKKRQQNPYLKRRGRNRFTKRRRKTKFQIRRDQGSFQNIEQIVRENIPEQSPFTNRLELQQTPVENSLGLEQTPVEKRLELEQTPFEHRLDPTPVQIRCNQIPVIDLSDTESETETNNVEMDDVVETFRSFRLPQSDASIQRDFSHFPLSSRYKRKNTNDIEVVMQPTTSETHVTTKSLDQEEIRIFHRSYPQQLPDQSSSTGKKSCTADIPIQGGELFDGDPRIKEFFAANGDENGYVKLGNKKGFLEFFEYGDKYEEMGRDYPPTREKMEEYEEFLKTVPAYQGKEDMVADVPDMDVEAAPNVSY